MLGWSSQEEASLGLRSRSCLEDIVMTLRMAEKSLWCWAGGAGNWPCRLTKCVLWAAWLSPLWNFLMGVLGKAAGRWVLLTVLHQNWTWKLPMLQKLGAGEAAGTGQEWHMRTRKESPLLLQRVSMALYCWSLASCQLAKKKHLKGSDPFLQSRQWRVFLELRGKNWQRAQVFSSFGKASISLARLCCDLILVIGLVARRRDGVDPERCALQQGRGLYILLKQRGY